jgi:glutaredoxin
MMTLVRWILGRVILGLDALTSPKSVVREEAAQRAVDEITASMSLYQFKTCPFCVKVRREIKRHGLNIELRDAKDNPDTKAELVREGGRHKVPCLRTENTDGSVDWLYESSDIVEHLSTKFDLA